MKKKLITLFFVFLTVGLLADAHAQAVWTRRDAQEADWLHAVVWAGSTTNPQPGAKLITAARFALSIRTSPEGVTWTQRETDNTGGAGSGYEGLAWVGNQAIAMSLADSRILTSPDGVTWTTRLTAQDSILFFPTAAATSGSLIVAVGLAGKALSSPDEVIWTERNIGIHVPFESVAWSGTQFVAVGGEGVIATSPDGIAWTTRNSGTANTLHAILSSGTQLVAVGDAGTILTSPDGIHWSTRASGTPNALNAATWTGSQWVAVGGDPSNVAHNVVLTSPDGVVWTGRSLGTTDQLDGIAWTGTQLVAVGQFGGVWTSPQDLTFIRPISGGDRSPPLRWAGSRLLVTVPDFLNTGRVTATIYGPLGDKRGEATEASGRTISVPAGSLSAGAYFLELRGAGGWRTWPFNVRR